MAHLPKGQGVVPMPPFLGWLSNNIPAVYDNTMSYYEELTSLIKYLQDTVIPALNADSEAITVISNAMEQLQSYVDHYFENLDVQEEINNKLDQMAEDGTLQEIITTYIQANVAWTFDTVADMKLATNLVSGSYARTLGFHSINDGGGAIYIITDSGTANEQDIIEIGSLYANLVKPAIVTPELYGAYGDGTHNDTSAIQRAMDSNSCIYMIKTYLINAQLNFNGSLHGNGTGTIKIDPTTRLTGAFIYSSTDLIVDGINFNCASNVTFTLDDKFSEYNCGILSAGKLIVKNCEFHNLYERFIRASGNTVSFVDIHDNLLSSDNKTNVYMAECISINGIVNSETIINIHDNTLVGFEYDYVGTYDNDYNINASGLVFANVIVKDINVNNNTLEHLGRQGSVSGNAGLSRLYPVDCYYNVTPLRLINNQILNCHWGGLRLHGCNNAIVEGNTFSVARACSEPFILLSDSYNSSGDAPVGCDDVTISNNKFYNKDKIYEYFIFINSYTADSTSGAGSGFHGHVNRLKIVNNELEFCCKKIFIYDYSLKTLYFLKNFIHGDFSDVQGLTQVAMINVDSRAVMKTATVGKSFANTILNLSENSIEWKGTIINARTTDSDLTAIYEQLTLNVENNTLICHGAAYTLYGMPNGGSKAINNLIKADVSGVFTFNTVLNNIIFYAGSGVDIYNATTSDNNSTYTN